MKTGNKVIEKKFQDVLEKIPPSAAMSQRNCNMFDNPDSAWEAFLAQATSDDDKHRNEAYEKWLFSVVER